jgi:hypothetical protein
MGISAERVRQLERRALGKLLAAAGGQGEGDLPRAGVDTRGAAS